MQKSTYAQELNRILASMNTNGSDASKDLQPLDTPQTEAEIEEEFDVYIEEDRITVVKRPEPEAQVIEAVLPPQPPPQPYFAYIALTSSLLLVCYLVTSAFFLTFFPPTVTVTILIKSQTIKASGTLQLPARQIAPITVSQSQTVSTTGKGHQDARSAIGYITFYNGLFTSQTVQAGTILTGNDGVQIITDQDAYISAANPPSFGYATVSAHALLKGVSGNIPSFDINEACCATAIKAVNTTSFYGGRNERDFSTVSTQDINKVSTLIIPTLNQSMQGALQTQVRENETLATLPCSPHIATDHQPGEEASTVQVIVSETCQGYAYSKTSFFSHIAAILSQQAVKELGSGYTRIGILHVTQISLSVTKNRVTITFTTQGAYRYALSDKTQSHIKQLLAGKQKKDALRILLSQPGINQAAITGIDDLAKLPKNPQDIKMSIIFLKSS